MVDIVGVSSLAALLVDVLGLTKAIIEDGARGSAIAAIVEGPPEPMVVVLWTQRVRSNSQWRLALKAA